MPRCGTHRMAFDPFDQAGCAVPAGAEDPPEQLLPAGARTWLSKEAVRKRDWRARRADAVRAGDTAARAGLQAEAQRKRQKRQQAKDAAAELRRAAAAGDEDAVAQVKTLTEKQAKTKVARNAQLRVKRDTQDQDDFLLHLERRQKLGQEAFDAIWRDCLPDGTDAWWGKFLAHRVVTAASRDCISSITQTADSFRAKPYKPQQRLPRPNQGQNKCTSDCRPSRPRCSGCRHHYCNIPGAISVAGTDRVFYSGDDGPPVHVGFDGSFSCFHGV